MEISTTMQQETLRKLQLTQLEIAREIRRVCRKNDIPFFLDSGSLLGAVRHQGFVPWDDDMDVGMLRQDYERFCKIAPEELGKDYFFQSWYTDPNYALPFGKVMKRGTVCLERKKTDRVSDSCIYVDVFPFDNVPEDPGERARHTGKLLEIYRMKLMKSGYRPWLDEGRILWKKRIGYLLYQAKALVHSGDDLVRSFDALASGCPETGMVCEQEAGSAPIYYDLALFQDLVDYSFEGESFPGVRDYDRYLTARFGDYMQLPPAQKRKGSHQFTKVEFGAEH